MGTPLEHRYLLLIYEILKSVVPGSLGISKTLSGDPQVKTSYSHL